MRRGSIAGWIAVAAGVYAFAVLVCLAVETFFPMWVWKAEIRGRVTDEQARPVASARVVAEYFGDRSCDPIPGSSDPAFTDELGQFVLTLVPGPVTLFARKDGIGISQPLDLELENEQQITGVELCLDLGGRIKGDCVRADGNPQPGRWVAIEQAGYRHHNEEDRIAQVRTDENGEFSFDGVPTGEIRVMLGNTSPSGPWYPFLQERVVPLMRAETIHVRFEIPLHPWER